MEKSALTFARMMNPANAQGGKPSYVDKSAETPGKVFHSKEGYPDAPAYRASNPRYWEYR